MPLYDHIEIIASPTSFYADISLTKPTQGTGPGQPPPRPRAPSPKGPNPMATQKELRDAAAERLLEAIDRLTNASTTQDLYSTSLLAMNEITLYVLAAITAGHPNPEGPRTDANTERTP